jgi:hypothetical protein
VSRERRVVSLDERGPLTQKVLAYTEAMRRLVPTIAGPESWAPLTAFVAVDRFARTGTFLEVHDWAQYVEMLTRWAATIDRFETTLRRVTESGRLVYFEIEERHFRGARVDVVNSMTVFEFDDAERIVHLDVYLQQAR